MISHVTFASIPVTDVDRAKAFWVEIVGFDETYDAEAKPGMRWTMLTPPGAQTAIQLQLVEAMPETEMPALPLVAPDVPGAVDTLRGKGVEILSEPGPAPWDETMTMATFRDSEGSKILLVSR
ncbi:MAG: VOC family protein [Pseudomonadota bacterium]